MEEILEFLKKAGCFYFATVEGDQPRVRPFGVVEIYNNKLYFLTGKGKNVTKQLHENNKIEICATIGEEWIRLEGTIMMDDERDAKKYFLDKNPQLRGMYSEDDQNTQLLYLEHGKATISSFTKPPKEINF